MEEPSTKHNGGQYVTLDAPLSKLPIFVKSGSIIVSQKPELTLTQARSNPFDLEVFLSGNNEKLPQGHLFWDNGVSNLQNKEYTYMKFFLQPLHCGSGWGIFNKIVEKNYISIPRMGSVSIYGVKQEPIEVKLGHKILEVVHDHKSNTLKMNVDVDLTEEFTILVNFKKQPMHALKCSEEKRIIA